VSDSARKECCVLDPAKLPSGLVVRQVWAPIDERDDRRPIAQVGDRRRGIAGLTFIGAGVLLAVGGLLAGLGFWPALAGLLIAMAGVGFASGGRTGFYEVDEDGGLGEYLGRSQPDVREMHTRC
jgi:hypothetical protein